MVSGDEASEHVRLTIEFLARSKITWLMATCARRQRKVGERRLI